MIKFLLRLDLLYKNRKFKLWYLIILSFTTIILLLIIPTFIHRTNYISSFWFDLFCRSILVLFFIKCFHFYLNLDQYYQKFFQGPEEPINQKPDKIKQTINIFVAIFVCGWFVYIFSITVKFFIQNINRLFVATLSIILGVLISIPLFSQFQKR